MLNTIVTLKQLIRLKTVYISIQYNYGNYIWKESLHLD